METSEEVTIVPCDSARLDRLMKRDELWLHYIDTAAVNNTQKQII